MKALSAKGRVGVSRRIAFRHWAIRRLAGKRLIVLNADFRDGDLLLKPGVDGGLVANCRFESTQPLVMAPGVYRNWRFDGMLTQPPRLPVRHKSVTEFSDQPVCGAKLRVGDEITFSAVDTTCWKCLQ